MANIKVSQQGATITWQFEPSTNISMSSTGGYYHGKTSSLEWTGMNLVYADPNSVIPTGGTLTSFITTAANGIDQMSLTGLNYQIQPGDMTLPIGERLGKLLAGNDNWTGTAGNETFIYGVGNDNYDGGQGLDTLYDSLPASYFSLDQSKTGFVLTMTKTGTSISGQISNLINVERIQFSDKMVALDLDGNAGQAYRLYQAAFNRTPDKAGLGYWIGQLDKGAESLNHVAAGFVNSAEFKQMYGNNVSDNGFLTALYNNVLHRNPDQAGFDYWNGRVAAGMTRPDILASFSESAENIAQVVGQIAHGIEYTPFA
ncbi:DUF4214 domain-containing protein [Undibacterium sp. TJN19]|uniref:DUF4214 domain-containing protein n=1 Tax=Undibacterium sp. TJN19 TaxID=3413055 RepID=UPI003BF0D6B5